MVCIERQSPVCRQLAVSIAKLWEAVTTLGLSMREDRCRKHALGVQNAERACLKDSGFPLLRTTFAPVPVFGLSPVGLALIGSNEENFLA